MVGYFVTRSSGRQWVEERRSKQFSWQSCVSPRLDEHGSTSGIRQEMNAAQADCQSTFVKFRNLKLKDDILIVRLEFVRIYVFVLKLPR